MSVSVDGLRPWEYWAMDSEEYDMIREVQAVYREEREDERRSLRKISDRGLGR